MSDASSHPQEWREQRVVALLLEELTAEEADQVRRWIEADPELAAFHRRMQATLDLVGEAAQWQAAEAAHEPAARLGDQRRNALLEKLRKPTRSASPRPSRLTIPWARWRETGRQVRWILPMAAAACFFLFVGIQFLILPSLTTHPSLAKYKQKLNDRASFNSDAKEYAETQPRYDDSFRPPSVPSEVPARGLGQRSDKRTTAFKQKPQPQTRWAYEQFGTDESQPASGPEPAAPSPRSAVPVPAPSTRPAPSTPQLQAGKKVSKAIAADSRQPQTVYFHDISRDGVGSVGEPLRQLQRGRGAEEAGLDPARHWGRVGTADRQQLEGNATRLSALNGPTRQADENDATVTWHLPQQGLPERFENQAATLPGTVAAAPPPVSESESLGEHLGVGGLAGGSYAGGSFYRMNEGREVEGSRRVAGRTSGNVSREAPDTLTLGDRPVLAELFIQTQPSGPDDSAAQAPSNTPGEGIRENMYDQVPVDEEQVQLGQLFEGIPFGIAVGNHESNPADTVEFQNRWLLNFDSGVTNLPAGSGGLGGMSQAAAGADSLRSNPTSAQMAGIELQRERNRAGGVRLEEGEMEEAAEPEGLRSELERAEELVVDEVARKLAETGTAPVKRKRGTMVETEPSDPARPKRPPADPLPEVWTAENPFSTFSLNVSDVSFKLAAASLANNALPEPGSIRSEEFVNAMDYHDPAPAPGAPLALNWDQARHPFRHNRHLLRFSIQTAAQGREPGRPLNLVLLLDNSGSMQRADRVHILREALEVLARQLTPKDRISVVTFARTARLWVDGLEGGNSDKLMERVGRLNPQGGTNLELALELAYDTARRHAGSNRVNRVILMTDGAANLGNVEPGTLTRKVEEQRRHGFALDCFGIGWQGYNDDLLERLARNGDGRYGFINHPAEAATEFADQLAGALQVAAANVKAQVEFNPDRVISYRQVGYEKHQLTKEQFRDNTVDAAEIGAAESGTALYTTQLKPDGSGPIGVMRARYQNPRTGQYHEMEWLLPYRPGLTTLDAASPSMRLAAVAGLFAEWLADNPYAAQVTLADLQRLLAGVPEAFPLDPKPRRLAWMIQKTRQLTGQ